MTNRLFLLGRQHPVFEEPDDNAIIWRFLEFPKFVSLLSKRALHMAHGHRLGDPWEGSLGSATLDQLKLEAKILGIPETVFIGSNIQTFRKAAPKATAVSCWHLGEHESAAMWQLYANRGVAIQTRCSLLRGQFGVFDSNNRPTQPFSILHLGKVKYIDYTKTVIPTNNTFWPMVHKRVSFKHEQEVRLAHFSFEDIEEIIKDPSHEAPDFNLPVNLDQLIEQVYISPRQPDWFLEVVKDTAAAFKFNPDRVVRSTLDKDPIF